jgi:GT2 family glycosyltransferase
MKVSAVVVTFNRLELLKECLENLLSQSYKLENIVVVNNNSNDGTKQYLDNLNNDVILPVHLNSNLGGAGGFYAGIKFAYEKTNSDYFWIMDDDTMPQTDSMKQLKIASEKLNYNFGFLSSNVRWWKDGSPCNVPGGLPIDWSEKADKNLIKLTNATFVSVLFSRDVVTNIGLPKKEMFIFGDDLEYTHRISSYNSQSFMVVNSYVIHKSAKSGVGEKIMYEQKDNRIKFCRYWYRNYLYIERLYGYKRDYVRDVIYFMFLIFTIPFRAKNKILTRMRNMIIGTFNGIFFNPKVDFPDKK